MAALTIVVLVGIIIFYIFFKKKRLQKEGAPDQSGKPVVQPVKKAPETTEHEQPEPETPVYCKSITLTVQSTDLRAIKEHGTAFSAALSGQALYLQDRLVFQSMPIAVTRIEPDGPAVIHANTAVKIKGTEDPIILHCPSCGEVQKDMQQICDTCKGELPVVIL
jgi:hypothetical protein